ncbi:zinc finger domain-containing protein [Streptomyces carpaticus]|uniref:DNA-binding phage zinc finger domain-containing protein n=1 Tax=Streptomyces carpaticus TaxID=285558 RepID=A0ABV4ZUE0_9ACTN
MGWICEPDDGTDLYDHEGYPVAVDAAGTELPPIQVRVGDGGTLPNPSWYLYDGRDGRPLAAAVVAGCECGWRSATQHPIQWDDHEATDGAEYGAGPWLTWSQLHIRPLLGSALPAALTDAMAAVRQQLQEVATARPLAALGAVRELEATAGHAARHAAGAAREQGASWADIGRELGTTRQAAHQRLARHLPARWVEDASLPAPDGHTWQRPATGDCPNCPCHTARVCEGMLWATAQRPANADGTPYTRPCPCEQAAPAPEPREVTLTLGGVTRTVKALYHHHGPGRGQLRTTGCQFAQARPGEPARAGDMILSPAADDADPAAIAIDDTGARWEPVLTLVTGTAITGWWDEQQPAAGGPDLSELPERHRAALTVACPACGSAPGELCTSHSGTRVRRSDVHQARTKVHQEAR